MPTNYNLPGSGQYTFRDYIGITPSDSKKSLFPSVLMQGGFQEMPTIQDRNEIPVAYASSTGFGVPEIGHDGWSSGRRRVGMLVHVLDSGSGTPKIYALIPLGYFGNGGNNGVNEWKALTDAQKFELLDPTATYNGGFTPPNNYIQAGGNGVNNPCPSGYRIPTETELDAERLSWSTNNVAGAFASPLKLPAAGSRDGSDGSVGSAGSSGNLMSSTVAGIESRFLAFINSNAFPFTWRRSNGFSVRCIKD